MSPVDIVMTQISGVASAYLHAAGEPGFAACSAQRHRVGARPRPNALWTLDPQLRPSAPHRWLPDPD